MLNTKHTQISFEFYPPKSSDGKQNLYQAAQELEPYHPDFFSVTFGAGGSTRTGTIETITRLKHDTNIKVAPHLSCIGYTRDELVTLLKEYKLLGVDRIVAIRGDLPSGMVASGDFKLAVELIELIRELYGTHFHINVAAYPEFHPQAKTAAHDLDNLKRKQEAGANTAITQYFYNSDAYFYFLDECEKHGVTLPIVPGIMPIMQFSKLVRFSELCGAEIPRWLYKRLEAYSDDQVSIRELGIEIVAQLCEHLLMNGAPGLHFYTLNQADVTGAILRELNIHPQVMAAAKTPSSSTS